MKRIKELIIIVVLTVLLVSAAEFLAGYLIYATQENTIRAELTVIAEENADDSAGKFTKIFDSKFAEFESMTLAELEGEYATAGYYHDGRIRRETAPDFLVNVTPAIINSIEGYQHSVSSFQYSDIFNQSSDSTEQFLFSWQYDATDYHMVTLPLADVLSSVTDGYFDMFAVVTNTGRISYTTNDGFAGKLGDYGLSSGFDASKITVNNQSYFAVRSDKAVVANGQWEFVGVLDYARIETALSAAMSNLLLIIILFGAFIFIAITAFVIFVSIKRKFRVKRRDVDKANYILKIDPTGEILKSSSNFHKFGSPNIFDTMVNKDLEINYANGSSFICCMMLNGIKKYVSFIVVNRDELLNLTIVGIDVDATKSETLNHEMGENEVTLKFGFRNKYTKAITSTSSQKILFGLVELINTQTLFNTFGPKVVRDANRMLEDRIRKYTEVVYPLDHYKGVIIVSDKEVEFFQHDINTFFSEVNKPITSGDMLVDVTVRGGFVMVDSFTPDKSYDYTYKCAQAALKRAKTESGAPYYVYHDSVKKQYAKYFNYDFDIAAMLNDNHLEMQYQPQYSFKQGKIVAFEALLRVNQASGKGIDIGKFIDYVQEEGLIGLIGSFTFEKCLEFMQEIDDKPVKISVNVSPIQFMQVGFVSYFANLVEKYKVDPQKIDIEITETFLMGNIEEAADKIKQLQKFGIGVHLDDFGKEYSSLNYLNKMPVASVKIDRDFIIGIAVDEKSRTIVRSIIDMVHKLGIEAIAEGVETETQFNLLKDMGCDLIQGFYIGKSMTDDKVKEMLNEQST